jgi:Transposase IS66 family
MKNFSERDCRQPALYPETACREDSSAIVAAPVPVKSIEVIVTHRPKYACRACEQAVVQAPAPERLIKAGCRPRRFAHVLVAKYAWHLPIYRQAQMLLAQGLNIKRAILVFWVGYAAGKLMPLYLRLREPFWPRARSRSTRPSRRSSFPAADAPKRDTSGRSPADFGAGPIRPPSPCESFPLLTRRDCS